MFYEHLITIFCESRLSNVAFKTFVEGHIILDNEVIKIKLTLVEGRIIQWHIKKKAPVFTSYAFDMTANIANDTWISRACGTIVNVSEVPAMSNFCYSRQQPFPPI